MSGRAWKTFEIRILKEHFPALGSDCMAMLSGRSRSAVLQKGRELGLVAPHYTGGRAPKKKLQSSEAIDAAIRTYFADPQGRQLDALAQRLGTSTGWIRRRGAALGIYMPNLRGAPWSEEELVIVRRAVGEGADRLTLRKQLLAAGFSRTDLAIASLLARRKAYLPKEDLPAGHLTLQAIAEGMGADWNTIKKWVESYGLRATRFQDSWGVATTDLRAWVLGNVARVNFHTLDKFWFMSLFGQAPRQARAHSAKKAPLGIHLPEAA